MRVTFTPTGRAEIVLAGEDDGEIRKSSPSDFVVNGEKTLQEARFFRGLAVLPLDRKNQKTSISFRTSWLFETYEDASESILTHCTYATGGGVLKLDLGVKTKRLNPAMIVSVSSRQIGITVFHTYNIVGGRIL